MDRSRILSVALAAAVLLGVAGCASAANDDNQTIYLDPDTGQVIQHPARKPPSARSSQKAVLGTSRSHRKSGYTRWQTKDGTPMLSVDPGQMPKDRVVRCPDGSLRMGGRVDDGKPPNKDHHGQSDLAKLCDQKIR